MDRGELSLSLRLLARAEKGVATRDTILRTSTHCAQ